MTKQRFIEMVFSFIKVSIFDHFFVIMFIGKDLLKKSRAPMISGFFLIKFTLDV